MHFYHVEVAGFGAADVDFFQHVVILALLEEDPFFDYSEQHFEVFKFAFLEIF